jgi:signal transduction histidine kinase
VIPRLRRGGLVGWLAAAFVLVGAIASVAVILVVLPTLESSIRGDRENRQARRVTAALREAAVRDRDALLAPSERRLRAIERLAVVDIGGEVRYLDLTGTATAWIGRGYLGAAPGPEAEGALRLGEGVRNIRVIGGDRVIVAAVPVLRNGYPAAVLEAAVPVDEGLGEIAVVRRRILLAVGAVLAVAALVGFLLSRLLAGRIQGLAATAATLARGDLSARAPASSPRELASLGESLNRMAERLEALVAETRAERDRAQGLVASLAEGVLAVGADGEVTVANEAARRYLGLSGEAATLRIDALPPPVAGAVREVMADGDQSFAREVALPDGSEVALTAAALRDGSAGAVLTLRDITEQRRLERARRDLVANVSHELKTPLAAIRGFLELLQEPSLAPERQREFLDLMAREVARLQRLIEEQVELARLDAGALPLELGPTDLGDLARHVADSRRALAERDGLRILVDVPEDPVVVEADCARVEQIALILMDNALRHTPAGGRVTLTVRRHGAGAALTVTDTGEGIPPEAQPFVFDRFYQADPSREGAGLGLGLAIARGLARAHGGDLTLTSTPALGSSFTLQLPVRTGAREVQPAGVADG